MLFLLSFRRARSRPRDADLDTAIAGLVVGLDEKRPRWMLFLVEKLESLRAQAQAQTVLRPASGERTGEQATWPGAAAGSPSEGL